MQFNQNFPLDFHGDNQMLQMQQQPGLQSQIQSDNGPMPLPGATAPSFMNYGTSAPQLQETQFRKGGNVSFADVAAKGRYGDTMLAHVNPREAVMLKQMGGSGTINPDTGLPEFFFRGVRNFFKNPGKTVKKSLKNPKRTIADIIGTLGAIYGGPAGGAIAGGLRSAIRGDGENPLLGALKGAGYAYGTNTVANLAGNALSSMGATTAGNALTNHAAENASSMFGNIGARLKSAPSVNNDVFSVMDKAPSSRLGISAGDSARESSRALINYDNITKEQLNRMTPTQIQDALSRKQAADVLVSKSLFEKAGDYLMKPEALTSLAGLGLNAYNTATQKKPKEKSPEELAGIQKRYSNSLRLTPAELAAQQTYFRNIDNINSPLLMQPQTKNTYRRTHTPEEYNQTGRWFSHYDNPQFSGMSLYKKGGKVKPKVIVEEMQVDYPMSASFLDGHTKGQDDKIPALLSDGEYVIDAATVSDLGDGNSNAGAKILDQFRDNIRKHKRGGKVGFPPKAKSPMEYIR